MAQKSSADTNSAAAAEEDARNPTGSVENPAAAANSKDAGNPTTTATADEDRRSAHRLRKQLKSQKEGVTYPFPVPPKDSELIEVAQGIYWLHLPLPIALDHVNSYILDDGDSWTIVDTGLFTPEIADIWEQVTAKFMKQKPLKRIVVTHYHPDHIGMAGKLISDSGGQLIIPRTSWLIARLLQIGSNSPLAEELRPYYRRAGLTDDLMAGLDHSMFSYTVDVPLKFHHLAQGDTIVAAGREWEVIYGQGHAVDHACLFTAKENIFIAGDQLLPQITSVIGASPMEQWDDPLAKWLDSCGLLASRLNNDTLVLPGHNEPFYGALGRLAGLQRHHDAALTRLIKCLSEPQRVVDTFSALFSRSIDPTVAGFATREARAHITHLLRQNIVTEVSPPSDQSGAEFDWYQVTDEARKEALK